ncbi:polysaccharide deacetylase family protein [Melghirimyces algeriensis]|uniref:Peptidoglycan/xylan/chitin deacetylase, PgdA/CDA1 family n=1 Tax=Melghirimyces algeriensis TaxID=910412 RepID=A0A521API5_9BACL|nr:polysaccharide deacetylase family protein [Melghirimyces algeriensis]SMO36560.1 Peptidoglycan/xylan/chitin deacetylase, PgdA/CDA1 family [Melghirimyces algeriensis]
MVFHWRSIFLLCTLLFLSTLTGCMPGTQKSQPKQPSSPEHPQPSTYFSPKEREVANLPTLEGGPEYSIRKPHPVSNDLLQRKYPDVFVLRAPRNRNEVALTFDDGPDQRFTPQVLDVLKKHRVKATFFLMGSRVKALPEVTRRIRDEGHVIGNHTYWHPNLPKESVERMDWEVRETEKSIQQATGDRPRFFRAPYGEMDEKRLRRLRDMGYYITGWSVDSLDWRQLPTEEIKHNVLSNTHPGSIILFHSGGHWTQDLSTMVEALDEIIPRLKADGIRFVTVPEMVKKGS